MNSAAQIGYYQKQIISSFTLTSCTQCTEVVEPTNSFPHSSNPIVSSKESKGKLKDHEDLIKAIIP